MNDDIKYKKIVFLIFLVICIVPSCYALFNSFSKSYGNLALAKWNVSLIQDGEENYLSLVPDITNASYKVNIESLSEVDVIYSIVINDLPVGVSIALDDGEFTQQSDNTIIFADVGNILYSDNDKTKSHVLTFKADDNANYLDNHVVNINVVVRQVV